MGAFPHVSPLFLVSLDPQRPLTAAGNLIGAGVRTARRLPEHAARLSLLGLQTALTVAETVRREYRTLREDGVGAVLSRSRHDEEFGYFGNVQEFPRPRTAARDAINAPQARAMGAPGTATEVVERVEAQLADAVPDTADLDAAALPLPDYDHLTLGSLRARLRRLSVPELLTLREYEKAHADRLQVVTMLDNRIAKLEAADAQPASDTDDGEQG